MQPFLYFSKSHSLHVQNWRKWTKESFVLANAIPCISHFFQLCFKECNLRLSPAQTQCRLSWPNVVICLKFLPTTKVRLENLYGQTISFLLPIVDFFVEHKYSCHDTPLLWIFDIYIYIYIYIYGRNQSVTIVIALRFVIRSKSLSVYEIRDLKKNFNCFLY